MTEQKTFRKIITDKEMGDIIKYCEETPVAFKYLKPIIQYITSIADDIIDKNKKS